MDFEEREFDLPGIRLSGKLWGAADGQPVLAIHGWMDNAGSFDLLAPLLKNHQILAIDTVGHGLSDHFPDGDVYNIWCDIAHLFGVADQMGWDAFALIGHSRGANVAAIMAGTFPKRISSLVLLDGGQPEIVEPDKQPEILAKSVLDKQNVDRQPTYVDTSEAAITLREKGRWKISREAIKLLAERGLSEKNGQFFWNADQKLKATSELRMTPDIMTAFYKRIAAPTLLILAREGLVKYFKANILTAEIPDYREITLPGSHHFHMSDKVSLIAAEIEKFHNSIC